MNIRIYGRTQECVETYNCISETVRKDIVLGSKGVQPTVVMVRNTDKIGEDRKVPVIAINGKVVSEAAIPTARKINDWLIKYLGKELAFRTRK